MMKTETQPVELPEEDDRITVRYNSSYGGEKVAEGTVEEANDRGVGVWKANFETDDGRSLRVWVRDHGGFDVFTFEGVKTNKKTGRKIGKGCDASENVQFVGGE